MKKPHQDGLNIFSLLLLTLVFLSDAASSDSTLKLEAMKKQVRERFPSVPQLSTTDYRRLTESTKNNNTILLDVREPEEYQLSHIKGAIISENIRNALKVLQGKPKNTPIVLYCSVGYRSSKLAMKLMNRGFTDVRNLEGAIFEWVNRGFAVYRGDKQVYKVHNYNARWGKLLEKEYHP